MSRQTCAHCDDGGTNGSYGRGSGDYGRGIRCPACLEIVCPSCRAMSGPTICGTYADGDEYADEIDDTETPFHRAARLAAWRRAGSSYIMGDQYPLNTAALTSTSEPRKL